MNNNPDWTKKMLEEGMANKSIKPCPNCDTTPNLVTLYADGEYTTCYIQCGLCLLRSAYADEPNEAWEKWEDNDTYQEVIPLGGR